MKTDCNGRYVYLNPRRGGQIAVAECARNVVCSGAKPAAITNCLNFGNPYKPENYWQFKEAVGGMSDACRIFETPVTGGNVSFYNESPTAAVYPTPTIGMLGIIEDLTHVTTSWFKEPGDIIFLIGKNLGEIGGSEYLKAIHGMVSGDAPQIDLNYEKAVMDLTYEAITKGLVNSAHDISDGGLAVALAECCLQGKKNHVIGATIRLDDKVRTDFLLFGETQSRIIISMSKLNAESFRTMAKKSKVDIAEIGTVGGNALQINNWIHVPVFELEEVYRSSIKKIMS